MGMQLANLEARSATAGDCSLGITYELSDLTT